MAFGVIVRHEGVNEPCLSRSVSTRGMFIGTKKRWPQGALVDVEIVHESTRLRIDARVANLAQNGVGLEFVDPDGAFLVQLEALLRKFVPAQSGRVAVNFAPDSEDAVVHWMLPEEEGQKGWFKKGGRNKTRLIDLSLDGAAIVAKKPPEVGTELVVYLRDPAGVSSESPDGLVQSPATVVRHTERGFAVQFKSPSAAFRRAISKIREAARQAGG